MPSPDMFFLRSVLALASTFLRFPPFQGAFSHAYSLFLDFGTHISYNLSSLKGCSITGYTGDYYSLYRGY